MTTKVHKISRDNAIIIYHAVCSGWQEEIRKIMWDQSGTIINVSHEFVMRGLAQADELQKKLLQKYFKLESENKLFEVKNYSHLCKITKTKELKLKDFLAFENPEKMLAFHQIKTIEKVYNEGWKPDFSINTQEKYYPYFINEKGVWRFHGSLCFGGFYGNVGLYKNKKISDFVGKTFMDIYLKVI